MSSITIGGYRNTNVENPRGGYWERFVVIIEFLDQRNGHFIRPNRVVFKYPNFKKDVNPNVHVKVFNFVVKVNAKTSLKISSMHSVIR
jgi:hypothetical protein